MSEPTASRPPRRTEIPIGVIVVGMAIAVWWPAFTIGAWGEPFFDQLLTLWAASTAAFAFIVVQRRPAGWRLVRAFVLLLPSVWLALSFVVDDETTDAAVIAVDLFGAAVVLLGLPFTVWVLARIMWPDTGEHMSARSRWFIVAVVGAIAVLSFLLGANNAAFMTCEEFAISGNSLPLGCHAS